MAGSSPQADNGHTMSPATMSLALKAAVVLNFFLAFGWMQSQGMCGDHEFSYEASATANEGGQPQMLRMSPKISPTVSP